MAVRSEDAAANGRAAGTRIALRDAVMKIGVVFAATGVLVAGVRWAVSINVEPLRGEVRSLRSALSAFARSSRMFGSVW